MKEKIRDRFELVILAATRTSELSKGITSTLKQNNKEQHPNIRKKKDVVTALHEIKANNLNIHELRKATFLKYKYKGAQPYKYDTLQGKKNTNHNTEKNKNTQKKDNFFYN